ncbi:hypothetical protein CDD81_4230 [Ophiocordyceps australis]|uniref:Transmembrane protein n=1 Tax=Ophiocordyceps australis TaxID=1399860 RepID=A0A2C5XAH3_9HYPO|nr:hypothetical protein CDD81_4230 [Ophiocordyceps australis]
MQQWRGTTAVGLLGLAVEVLSLPVFNEAGPREESSSSAVGGGAGGMARRSRPDGTAPVDQAHDEQPAASKTDGKSHQLPLFTIGVLAAIVLTFFLFWGLHHLFRRRARRTAAAHANEKRAAQEAAAATPSPPSPPHPPLGLATDAPFLSLPPYEQRASKRDDA